MGSNQFAERLVETMLGWMRWLVNWVWAIFRSGAPSSLTSWFADHWMAIVVLLVIVGVIVDWLVWMIRWRPYWLWFRKKQIIYEDDREKQKAERPTRVHRPTDGPHFHGTMSKAAEDDFEDPFAEQPQPRKVKKPQASLTDWEGGEDPYAPPEPPAEEMTDWEGGEDPYAPEIEAPQEETELTDWEGGEDPYAAAQPAEDHRRFMRPTGGESKA